MFHIVDDEENIRTFLAEVVALMGYEAETFGCPGDYLEYAKSDDFTPPYALLSDVQMPKMNGYEMLDQVRQIHPAIRTAIISGYPNIAGEAKTTPCIFLSKPIVMEQFEQAIQSFVSCHENGPKAETNGCGTIDNHELFGHEAWFCPLGKRCENC